MGKKERKRGKRKGKGKGKGGRKKVIPLAWQGTENDFLFRF